MTLDLIAFQLPGAVTFEVQKCLLPQQLFTQIGHSGQWANCYFKSAETTFENVAMCQVFPAQGDNACICYLDLTVCRSMEAGDSELVLTNVVPITAAERALKVVEVDFFLNADHYIQHSSSVSRAHLKQIAHTLLKLYHYSASSFIRSPDLSSEGVDFIRINIPGCGDMQCYVVNDDTIVNIKKISLTPTKERNQCPIANVSAFQSVRQQLDEFMYTTSHRVKNSTLFKLSPNALIIGQEGSGKSTLLEQFLANNCFNVFRVITMNVLKQYPGETEAELRKIFKAAGRFHHYNQLEPTAIIIEDLHLLCSEVRSSGSSTEFAANCSRVSAQLISLVDELHSLRPNVFCFATTSFPDNLNAMIRRPGRFDREITIPQLSKEDRQEVIKELVRRIFPNACLAEALLETIASQTQGFAIADLTLLMHNVYQGFGGNNTEVFNIDYNIVKQCLAKSQSSTWRASSLTTCVATEGLASIGGMTQLMEQLKVSVLAALTHRHTYERFGLTFPKGLLLYGPPGCAKTTIAKCLAAEAGMKFLATSGAEVYSPFVGCAEKFIAKLFTTARKNAPCLIFLDEIDSLVGRRAINSSAVNDVQTRILSTLLTEMDGIIGTTSSATDDTAHILVVAATNRPDMIDDALMRPGRFDKLIHVPVPDLLTRHSILSLLKGRMPFAANVDLQLIARCTETFSGADICNLCNEAAMCAFQRNPVTTEITSNDFERVMETTKSSLTPQQINKYYQFERQFSR